MTMEMIDCKEDDNYENMKYLIDRLEALTRENSELIKEKNLLQTKVNLMYKLSKDFVNEQLRLVKNLEIIINKIRSLL